jgi:cellulose synthase/poly-beta-1,6-N-acetylglucosamine synthase-like glycosyltransferase
MSGSRQPGAAVVIPCFNQGHYLAEAIESVLSQTLPPSEVVVIDDGSEDNSYEVAGRYKGVRRIRQQNKGVAAARNAGWRKTSARCLVFLDADDRLLPDALQMGTEALQRRPQVAFVAGFSRDIGGDGRVMDGLRQPLVGQDHYLRLLEDCFIWSGSSIVYRRSALEAVGGFDESLDAADDYELYMRLARRFPVFCHGGVVTDYRRHGTNTTRDAAIVLTSQLEVQGRQRREVRDRLEREALRRGIGKTRREHGRALAEQIGEDWRHRRRRRALRGLRTLFRCDPRGLARLVSVA